MRKHMSVSGGCAAIALFMAASAVGQTKAPAQVVKPPVSQAWIDVATFAGFGMPMSPGASPMSMMGGMMGGGPSKNSFGMTQAGSSGRWVDVTLFTSRNPSLAEGTQGVPPGTQLAPTLKLVAPRVEKGPPPTPGDESVVEPEYERPKGKLYLYWGCGDTVRAGQPRVLDMATARPDDYGKFFTSRRATQRGAHTAPGRPQWPNEIDSRMVQPNASLVGEHTFTGQGVPEGFKFAIGPQQDLMPPIELKQTAMDGAVQLEWAQLPTARATFIAAMGAKGGSDMEMVFWSSSEVPELGMGLIDYQTNPAVDRWLKEKVLLEPGVTRCIMPKGVFPEGGGAMLRMIAYGTELNLVHPPRPADPKVAWEPQWAVKLRVKSVATVMLGMDMSEMQRGPGRRGQQTQAPQEAEPTVRQEENKTPGAVDILRGILGR
ncbi:MAG TPA: hypothetical protein VMK32_01350 [Burkholderiaceae bacterium]|nr:hypothetical protein [Burkholderiaceae bacterium]